MREAGQGRKARRTARLAALAALPLVAGCGAEARGGSAGAWEAVTDTVADTVVVRTVAGSVWQEDRVLVPEVEIGVLEGEQPYMFGRVAALEVGPDGTIYALDSQVPEIRLFGPDGAYLRTLGRPGEGPGELKQPRALTLLSDGRLLVRDHANARIQVYAADGSPADSWPIRGNFSTSNPLWRDREDRVYDQILIDPEADLADWEMGLVRIAADGTPGDTLRIPDAGFEPPFVEARREDGESRSVSRNSVPFAATETWTVHPDGYFIHGVSTDYRFTLLRPGAPLRIERAADPVPVAAGEKAEAEATTTANMRNMVPNWRWNGPPIPDTKPPFQNLQVGRDGRLWVRAAAPGVERDDPDHDPSDPGSVPDRWREPVLFDVFEADGRYLGAVRAPQGFSLYPQPVFDGDRVWAVVRDDFDVQRVVRFRVVGESEAGGATQQDDG